LLLWVTAAGAQLPGGYSITSQDISIYYESPALDSGQIIVSGDTASLVIHTNESLTLTFATGGHLYETVGGSTYQLPIQMRAQAYGTNTNPGTWGTGGSVSKGTTWNGLWQSWLNDKDTGGTTSGTVHFTSGQTVGLELEVAVSRGGMADRSGTYTQKTPMSITIATP
jgi:hypothetical protein